VTFARRVFFWAGIYGIAVLAPLYVIEDWLGRRFPPPITHPEFYYGFTGLAIAWQFVFLVISRDVVRYRPLMPAAMAEKFLFVLSSAALYVTGRMPADGLAGPFGDLVLGVLFVAAWVRTAGPARDASSRVAS
jgi:hypothetical protein